MKKIFFALLMIGMIISSCTTKVQEKPFLATDVDSITIEDGADNPVRFKVKFTLGYDSTDVINEMVKSEEELEQFVSGIFRNLKNECKYPRTFKPTNLYGFSVEDTAIYKGEVIYNIKIVASGVASNAFGVEQDINDVLDLLAWRENITADDGDFAYWHIYPREEWWANIIQKDIDKLAENKEAE